MTEHRKPSWNPFSYSPSQLRKALVSLLGFAVTFLAVGSDLLPDGWDPYVAVFVALCASYGVFAAPNTPPGPVKPTP